ncbi:hypothetical protein Psuf_066150 [Phytohabitans suffuscus]|uniref:Uncharacterized protein n=1 Tax=Phytohabitans suffuscus TaxID=624315 RepID=A0A6F8YT64_9ACTN|nr:hypothetical protein Psuf_066150 [Phytohabitans suffuscus]
MTDGATSSRRARSRIDQPTRWDLAGELERGVDDALLGQTQRPVRRSGRDEAVQDGAASSLQPRVLERSSQKAA